MDFKIDCDCGNTLTRVYLNLRVAIDHPFDTPLHCDKCGSQYKVKINAKKTLEWVSGG